MCRVLVIVKQWYYQNVQYVVLKNEDLLIAGDIFMPDLLIVLVDH